MSAPSPAYRTANQTSAAIVVAAPTLRTARAAAFARTKAIWPHRISATAAPKSQTCRASAPSPLGQLHAAKKLRHGGVHHAPAYRQPVAERARAAHERAGRPEQHPARRHHAGRDRRRDGDGQHNLRQR